jgi:pyruvate-ferredoxin/flavodoxin oxidoreductase
LPRFWGELAQPRVEEAGTGSAVDPLLTLGAVPPYTASFYDATEKRNRAPRIDESLCTGCGKCWAVCPDAALCPVSIGVEALLNAAADRAAPVGGEQPDPAAGKLKRSHKQLAARVDTLLAKSSAQTLTAELVREAYGWLVEKMSVSDEERPAFDAAFESTLKGFAGLPLSVTETLFHGPHQNQKGSGELLVLSVDPRTCQACGGCSAICPEGAITMEKQAPDTVRRMREVHAAWETLPDTAGTSVARACEDPELGALPAILLSRHCQQAVTGSDGAEPGSGERLAARLTIAVVEYQMQRRLKAHLDGLGDLSERLRQKIRDVMAEAVSVENLGQLSEALRSSPNRPSNLGQVVSRLNDLGERTTLDVRVLEQLTEATERVEALREQLKSGANGDARARFGLVVAGESALSWAAAFPRNPFGAPVAVDPVGDGTELALGIARGMHTRRVDEARLLRRAELLIESPSDRAAKDRDLDALTFADLTPEEKLLCPPVLLLCPSRALSAEGIGGLGRILSSDFPVKAVVLDGCEPLSDGTEPTLGADVALTALSVRRAFVVSTSVACLQHLFDGVTGALGFAGPALVQLTAPSPRRHGFAQEATVARARLAVDARLRPLLQYDPGAEGVFGQRLSLQGNPALEDSWVADDEENRLTPADWAAGEGRFAGDITEPAEGQAGMPVAEWADLPAGERTGKTPTITVADDRTVVVGPALAGATLERKQNWVTLQELSGVVTPFTDEVREKLRQELSDEHRQELAALKAEYESKISEIEAEHAASTAAQLRDRLMQLVASGKASRAAQGKEEN